MAMASITHTPPAENLSAGAESPLRAVDDAQYNPRLAFLSCNYKSIQPDWGQEVVRSLMIAKFCLSGTVLIDDIGNGFGPFQEEYVAMRATLIYQAMKPIVPDRRLVTRGSVLNVAAMAQLSNQQEALLADVKKPKPAITSQMGPFTEEGVARDWFPGYSKYWEQNPDTGVVLLVGPSCVRGRLEKVAASGGILVSDTQDGKWENIKGNHRTSLPAQIRAVS